MKLINLLHLVLLAISWAFYGYLCSQFVCLVFHSRKIGIIAVILLGLVGVPAILHGYDILFDTHWWEY